MASLIFLDFIDDLITFDTSYITRSPYIHKDMHINVKAVSFSIIKYILTIKNVNLSHSNSRNS